MLCLYMCYKLTFDNDCVLCYIDVLSSYSNMYLLLYRWVFRYLLQFHRDGTLPQDNALLIALYKECVFWSCNHCMAAIEENKVRTLCCTRGIYMYICCGIVSGMLLLYVMIVCVIYMVPIKLLCFIITMCVLSVVTCISYI